MADSPSAAKKARTEGSSSAVAGREYLLSVYRTKLLPDLLTEMRDEFEMDEDAVAWVKDMVEYTVPGGKLNRALFVLESLRFLVDEAAYDGLKEKAAVCGWAIEWLQAYFLIEDDIMDGSITRRGAPCWYKKDGVGMIAINDGIVLDQQIFRMLKAHFGADPAMHARLLELFHETTYQTALGQLLDTTMPINNDNLRKFSTVAYKRIVKYKTAFYSFYLPVACAMALAGLRDEVLFEQAKRICMMVGEYFQVQDDYLDCYGAPEVIGKVGTDIEDCKCGWLAVQFLDGCSAEDMAKFKRHYGKHDKEDVAAVKALYAKAGMEATYHAYEEATYAEITQLISHVTGMPKDVFTNLVNKIYKRGK